MVAFRPDLACFGGRPDAVLKHVSLRQQFGGGVAQCSAWPRSSERRRPCQPSHAVTTDGFDLFSRVLEGCLELRPQMEMRRVWSTKSPEQDVVYLIGYTRPGGGGGLGGSAQQALPSSSGPTLELNTSLDSTVWKRREHAPSLLVSPPAAQQLSPPSPLVLFVTSHSTSV